VLAKHSGPSPTVRRPRYVTYPAHVAVDHDPLTGGYITDVFWHVPTKGGHQRPTYVSTVLLEDRIDTYSYESGSKSIADSSTSRKQMTQTSLLHAPVPP